MSSFPVCQAMNALHVTTHRRLSAKTVAQVAKYSRALPLFACAFFQVNSINPLLAFLTEDACKQMAFQQVLVCAQSFAAGALKL